MSNISISEAQEFTLELDEDAIKKFEDTMNDEGLMRAGFIIHESNNITFG